MVCFPSRRFHWSNWKHLVCQPWWRDWNFERANSVTNVWHPKRGCGKLHSKQGSIKTSSYSLTSEAILMGKIWIWGVSKRCQKSLCNFLFHSIWFCVHLYLIMPQTRHPLEASGSIYCKQEVNKKILHPSFPSRTLISSANSAPPPPFLEIQCLCYWLYSLLHSFTLLVGLDTTTCDPLHELIFQQLELACFGVSGVL